MKNRFLLLLTACSFLAASNISRAQELPFSSIETIAGAEPARVAGPDFSFGSISGMTADAAGNTYFSIQALNRVYRLGTDGYVTVYAGNGVHGKHHDGALAAESPLMSPTALAVDADGNLLISCWNAPAWNALLRVDAASGILSTVFTTLNPRDQPESANSIHGVADMIVGSDGTLYVVDDGDQRIKSYSFGTGSIAVVAGNGTLGKAQPGIPATASPLKHPRSVAVSPDGTIYFTAMESTVFHVRRDGKLETLSIAVKRNTTPPSEYDLPSHIALDGSGNLFVTQPNLSQILRIALKSGRVSIYAGTGEQPFNGDDINAARANFMIPMFVTSDSAGNLIISEEHRIRRVDASSHLISTIAGNGLPATDDASAFASRAKLWEPAYAVPASDGSVYITSSYSSRLLRISSDGVLTTAAGGGDFTRVAQGPGPASEVALNYPQAIWPDDNGDVYFSDFGSNLLRRFDPHSGLVTNFAKTPINSNSVGLMLYYSAALVADGEYFYLSAPYARSVWRISRRDGAVELYAGAQSDAATKGEFARSVRLANPSGLALDSLRNLYIADGMFEGKQGRILRVDATDGRVTTILSNLRQPSGLAFLSPTVLCFAETGANRVRCVDLADHSIRVLAGTGVAGFSGDGGPAECAELNRPSGISFDPSGNLYIADTGNQRVRRVRLGQHTASCQDHSESGR
jgi:sugar lactone lactonase YvrE